MTNYILLYQGYIESIASKNPKDLTKLFEQISGSGSFIKEYDRLLEEKDENANVVLEIQEQKKGITLEKNQLNKQVKEQQQYHDLTKRLVFRCFILCLI